MNTQQIIILVGLTAIVCLVVGLAAGFIVRDFVAPRRRQIVSAPTETVPASPIATVIPTWTPTLSPEPPTPTLAPTKTPVPTQTPRPAVVNTPEPTWTPTKLAPTAGGASGSIGTIRVDHWLLEITDVRSDPGMGASRQSLVLLGDLTNEGTQTDGFVAVGTLMLQDSVGRTYEDDFALTQAAVEKYGAEIPVRMNPGATRYVAIGFDVPADEKSFTIIPGSLAASWGGDVTFAVP